MNTKKICLLLVLLTSAFAAGAETIEGCDARITYIGRTAVQDGATFFDWSATTARVRFTGSTLTLRCADTHADYFNVWVDKTPCATPDFVFKATPVGVDTTITLFKGKRGTHNVTIQKRTEGEQGTAYFIAFSSDGKFLQADPARERLIEFVGDSYTCGYGTEAINRNQPFRPAEENPSMTYADIIGRYFDAEAIHISHSGRGIARNYGGYNAEQVMTNLYPCRFNCFCKDPWTPSYHPDIVVIYLGTNDFSCSEQPSLSLFTEKYCLLLSEIRAFHPDVPILCVASMADPLLRSYIADAVSAFTLSGQAERGVPSPDSLGHGMFSGPGVWFTSIDTGAHNQTSDLGASWHPNYSGHQKVAHCMIPYISTITGWEMPFKAVE